MALDDILDEHEQSERVLDWLRRNGAALIGGIALGLALIFGWHWWQGRQQAAQADAAARFQQMVDGFEAGNLAEQSKLTSFEQPLYRTLGGLSLAKAQLAADQRDAAIATLRGIDAKDPALAAIVRERLARLLVDSGKPADAVTLLGPADTAGALEARGDAQFALGERDAARASYVQALKQMDVDAPQRRLVELKLTQVGGIPSQPEAQS